MFYLRHPEKADEMIQLEVIFTVNHALGAHFEGSKAIWTRGGKPDATIQAPPLEVFHIRLDSGVSWQLKISGENTIDRSRITPAMEAFAKGIKFVKPPADQNPAVTGFKVFTSAAKLPVVGMEQKTTFRYSLRAHPSYLFELSRYDEYNGHDHQYPTSTQWAASFYDREWDLRFGENVALGIGQSTSWNPHACPIFRPTDQSKSMDPRAGFVEFYSHVKSVASFLDNLKGISSDTEGPNTVEEISGKADSGSERELGG
ncbi:MAG: hypothetical protein Q9219_003387 [cf. Caloplaca sp. 3 TL-2023]